MSNPAVTEIRQAAEVTEIHLSTARDRVAAAQYELDAATANLEALIALRDGYAQVFAKLDAPEPEPVPEPDPAGKSK